MIYLKEDCFEDYVWVVPNFIMSSMSDTEKSEILLTQEQHPLFFQN